jgi:hypothetical protein
VTPSANAATMKRGLRIASEAVSSCDSRLSANLRLQEVNRLAERVMWAYTSGREILALESSTHIREQVHIVLVSPGDVVDRKNPDATFLTQEDGDGQTRIYVRPAQFTPTWIGIVLFHELSHVLEHRDGTWSNEESGDEQWWQSEARAYALEAAVIDAITGWKLSKELAAIVKRYDASALDEFSTTHALAKALVRKCFEGRDGAVPASNVERQTAEAALCCIIALASWAAPMALADVDDPAEAGAQLRLVARKWGFLPG